MVDVLREVRRAADELDAVVGPAGHTWPKVAAALSAICRDVEHKLSTSEFAVLIVGPHDDTRALIDDVIGDHVVPEDLSALGAALMIRQNAAARFLVSLEDGTRIDSATTLPDRVPFLDEAVASAEREVAESAATIAQIKEELASRASAAARVVPAAPAAPVASNPGFVGRLLAAFRAFIARLAGRNKALPPMSNAEDASGRTSAEELASRLLECEAHADRARQNADRLRRERVENVEAHRAAFRAELAALARPGAFGKPAVEILVEYPCARLAPGLLLVSPAASSDGDEKARMPDNLGGVIVVGSPVDVAAALEPIVPHAHVPARLASTLARIRVEAPTVVAARTAIEVCGRLKSLAAAGAKAESASRERLHALEHERMPEAAQFRDEQMTSMQLVIEERTHHAVGRAAETVRARLAELEADWVRRLDECANRAALTSLLAEIGADAPKRLAGSIERAMDEVAAELNATSDTLQTWMLDALTVKYGTLGSEDDPKALIVTDFSGQVGPVSVRAPLQSIHDAFERKRVNIGLGGAAAGAAVGTVILPGIGTAIGAMVGVLAGFVEGTDALKRRSVESLRKHLRAAEAELTSQIDQGRVSLANDLRLAVEETLDDALVRRGPTIRALLDAEEQAIARERERLAELEQVRAVLDQQCARFTTLADVATRSVRDLAGARS